MQQNGELGRSADLDILASGMVAVTQGGLVLGRTAPSAHPVTVALYVTLARVRAARGDW